MRSRASFSDPLQAVHAVVELQRGLADPAATANLKLDVRCAIHLGEDGSACRRRLRRDRQSRPADHGRPRTAASCALAGGGALVRRTTSGRTPSSLISAAFACAIWEVPSGFINSFIRRLRRSFPPLRSLETRPNNLPQQLTSFVGRESELAEVKRRLYRNRLVTVSGVGGWARRDSRCRRVRTFSRTFPTVCGSSSSPRWTTRVAFPGGGLGARHQGGSGAEGRANAVEHVESRQLLLILDNCEHLALAVAELAKNLLQASPRAEDPGVEPRAAAGSRREKIFAAAAAVARKARDCRRAPR
jgi:hypothetical protein